MKKVDYNALFEGAKRILKKNGYEDVWDYHYNAHYMTITDSYNRAIANIDFNGNFI